MPADWSPPKRRQKDLDARWTKKQKQGKPYFGYKLSRCNRRIAIPRAHVEHVFTDPAKLGGKVLRSIGLAHAVLHLHCKAASYNLRRLCYLREAKISAS